MAIDFGGVATTDNYATGFIPKLNEVLKASAFMFDPALISYTGTPYTGTKRLNSGALESYNGTSWVAQSINGLSQSSGAALIGGAFKVTNNTGLPAAGGGGLIIDYASSVSRAYIGDGTGYEFRIASRTGSSTTDRVWFGDDGRVGIGAAHIAGGNLLTITKSATYSSESTSNVYLRTGSGAGNTGMLLGTDQTNVTAYIQSIEPGTSYASRQLALNPNGGFVRIGNIAGGNGPLIVSGGAWGSFGATTVAGSFMTFYRGGAFGTTVAGYLGTDGGGAIAGGTGTAFGVRSDGDLFLSAGGTGIGLRVNATGQTVNFPNFIGIGLGSAPVAPIEIDTNQGELARWNCTNANGGFLRWRQSGSDVGYFGTGANLGPITTGDFAVLASTSKNLVFGANNDLSAGNRLMITTGGIVVVGANSGSSIGSGLDKLAVAGGIGTSGIQFNTNASANYEFVHRTAGMGWYFYTNGAAQVPFKILSGAATDTLVVNSTGVMYGGIEVGYRDVPLNVQAGTYSVVAADRGKVVVASGNVTVNTGLTAGAAILVYNNTAGTIQLIQGTSLTLRKAGTTTTGTVTIAARGFANVLSLNAGEYVVSGNVT